MSTPANTDSTTITENSPAAQSSEDTVTMSKAELDNLNKRLKDQTDNGLRKAQEAAELRKQNEALVSKVTSSKAITADLPAGEKERLDALKFSDPDKWLEELTAIKATSQEALNSTLNEAKSLAGKEFKAQTDEEFIASFVKENPSISLASLQNDVPYSMKAKFDNDELSVEEFLTLAKDYFDNKGTKGSELPNNPTLSEVNGSSQASKGAGDSQVKADYANVTF